MEMLFRASSCWRHPSYYLSGMEKLDTLIMAKTERNIKQINHWVLMEISAKFIMLMPMTILVTSSSFLHFIFLGFYPNTNFLGLIVLEGVN